jgi:septum formation protein
MGSPSTEPLGFQAEGALFMLPISASTPLVLGSGSPRRREILTGMGLALRILPADVAEDVVDGEPPHTYLERVVRDKLVAVSRRLDSTRYAGVLVADTIVVLDEQILGKPRDEADAARLVGQLVGRTHEVFTRYAVSVAAAPARAAVSRTVASRVTMRAADAAEVTGYAGTGEGLDKAGAYAVQGLGAFLVERIEGSYSNVIGLPACEVIVDLREVGLLERFP